jgi:tungstate transport system substrate-binding protein
MLSKLIISTFLCLATFLAGSQVLAEDRFILIASTTSTQDSGLFKFILPIFKTKTGIEVRVIAQGSGQALASGRRGDVDVVLVHDKDAELQFIADGFGIDRREVMYNDFVLIGPKSDNAKVGSAKDAVAAFKTIAQNRASFVSRGDNSGTHTAEIKLWKLANVAPSEGKGSWYRETGSGMGPTLNTASAMNAYAFTDRGTWLSFKNRGDLRILVEGDSVLVNQYGVMLVNPLMHPHVKKALGQAFIDWITSVEGQSAIASFKVDGQSLFFPNYKK